MEAPIREVVTRAITIPRSLRRTSRLRRDLMLITAIASTLLGFLAHVLYVSLSFDIGNRVRKTAGTRNDDVIRDGLDGVDERISTSGRDDQNSVAQRGRLLSKRRARSGDSFDLLPERAWG
uniref:Transmembrane protein n=1 Tax=Rhodosorus marinus TaxID=101924 RepID=A0A7S0G3M2_9RHOD